MFRESVVCLLFKIAYWSKGSRIKILTVKTLENFVSLSVVTSFGTTQYSNASGLCKPAIHSKSRLARKLLRTGKAIHAYFSLSKTY